MVQPDMYNESHSCANALKAREAAEVKSPVAEAQETSAAETPAQSEAAKARKQQENVSSVVEIRQKSTVEVMPRVKVQEEEIYKRLSAIAEPC